MDVINIIGNFIEGDADADSDSDFDVDEPIWRLSGDQAIYGVPSEEPIVTVTGVKSIESLAIDTNNKVVTIGSAALNQTAVSIIDGYTLALASYVDQPIISGEHWTYNDGTAIYTSSETIGGYKVVDNQIIYVADKSSEHVEISGVTSRDGITRDGDTFIIPAAILNKRNVTISAGYPLALTGDVATASSFAEGWTREETTATYRRAGTSEGYSVDDDQIVYAAASGGATVVTVSGVKSTKGLYLNETDKVVTVYKSALNETNITISDGYTLELDSGATNDGEWTLEGTKATYIGGSSPYRLVDNEIIYTAPSGDEILAELDGVAKVPTFNDDDAIQLKANNFDEDGIHLLSNKGGFGIELEDADGATFTGSDARDKIINNASNVTIAGGKGSDNVTVSGGTAGNTFVYNRGDGKDVIFQNRYWFDDG